jgi:hypothetical protein
MAILYRVDRQPGTDSPDLVFFCPGCQCGHGVWTTHSNAYTGATWSWNGNMDKPTFAPSILVQHNHDGKDLRCHTTITDGRIHFYSDCTHGLAGQDVDMVEF